jgi:hypothetical protein
MPMEPIREQVMVAVTAQLATIQAGTVVYSLPSGSKAVDYWTTPSLISRALLWLPQYDQPLTAGVEETQLDRGPVLGVVRSSGSDFERIMHTDPAGPVALGFEHHQRLTIWGYVKATPLLVASTLIERLWQDVTECLLVDPTFGKLALKAEPDGSLDTDDGAMEPLGFFAQDWLVVV